MRLTLYCHDHSLDPPDRAASSRNLRNATQQWITSTTSQQNQQRLTKRKLCNRITRVRVKVHFHFHLHDRLLSAVQCAVCSSSLCCTRRLIRSLLSSGNCATQLYGLRHGRLQSRNRVVPRTRSKARRGAYRAKVDKVEVRLPIVAASLD